MTSRIPNLVGVEREGHAERRGPVLVDPVRVSEGMVDEAVESVVRARGLRPDAAEALKFALARDTAGGPMHAYYTSKAAMTRKRMVGVGRKELTVGYALTSEEVQDLSDYAPEFKLRFQSTISHDHAMAAATRIIDNRLIFSRLPERVPFSDIGGNPLTYVKAEREHWHVCGPTVDAKDPMRHQIRAMEARQIVNKGSGGRAAELASAVLRKDYAVGCGVVAQKCVHQTPIGVAIHVYDVPMRDWPAIMENKAMSVVEGCLLFSSRFFEETQGELGVSKARFEIDVESDTFRMGFSNSPSWWYEHKFSEYMLYGTDQLMNYGAHTYAYKIVERRGDTLFYRILRMDSSLGDVDRRASFKTPGVPVVRVKGFELSKTRLGFRPALDTKTYTFPKNLWQEMVSQASEDFERGVMDFNKMYNHYRTISVRHTINAVLVMGGEQVDADGLVPLVVHACLAAAAQSLLGQRETRAITENAQRLRQEKFDSTGAKMLKVLNGVFASTYAVGFGLCKAVVAAVANAHYSSLEQWVLDWEPVCEITSVPVSSIRAVGSSVKAISAEVLYKKAAIDGAPFDHFAAVIANPELASVVKKMCPQLALETPEPSVTAPPSYVTDQQDTDLSLKRVAAIKEHIEETHLQNRAVAFVCQEAYSDLSVRGEPNKSALMRKAELHRNPDFWKVENGVLTGSVLGFSAEEFKHSAVYHPSPDDVGNVVRVVYQSDWEDDRSKREQRNFVISDKDFSGWVLVTDDLVVYNGPEIIEAMEKALPMRHDYTVELCWGPPGCGKTYSIIQSLHPDGSDIVMCPVRESITSTREEILGKYPDFPSAKLRVRTVDSYLVRLGVDKRTASLRAERLLADECFMTHAGKWYAAAALLGVTKLSAYGDDYQIPHIPRVQAPKLFVKLSHQLLNTVWVTRRCPATAVAAWGSVYDWKVRSHSGAIGVMREVRDTKGMDIPTGCVMMCMYQADKKELKKMYAADIRRIKIMTAHESEGKTFEHVWLHRFDQRKRSDKFSLFDQQPHVLVAMSRHKLSFVYRCPAALGDLVSKWVVRSADARRVAAAQEVSTAGESVEKL